jgi:hypothetical protein
LRWLSIAVGFINNTCAYNFLSRRKQGLNAQANSLHEPPQARGQIRVAYAT